MKTTLRDHSLRCSIPEEPLVFIHVALVSELLQSMEALTQQTGDVELEQQAKWAIFYSISATQMELQVADFDTLIQQPICSGC